MNEDESVIFGDHGRETGFPGLDAERLFVGTTPILRQEEANGHLKMMLSLSSSA